jgi:intergrase/recombinase
MSYACNIRKYLSSHTFEQSELRDYLATIDNPNTYNNWLKSFIAYARFTGINIQFKFTKVEPILRVLPTKKELNEFFNALDTDYERLLFIGYACSGLRTELLNITMNNIDFTNHALYPNHISSTKRSYVSFYKNEFEELLPAWLKQRYPKSVKLFSIGSINKAYLFSLVHKKTQLNITPKVLRFWFANEMAKLGVPDRFIDAFQGRIPRSVLARHYTDYSLDSLKQIYDKADLSVLS